MKNRYLLAACAALVLLVAPGPRASAANVSFSLRIGDPYPGPRLAFVEQPDIVVIPGTRVYYIDDYDYDIYRYGSYWYYCYDGGWYRSVDYDGPFFFISYESVPYSIRYVPVRYRHHWRNYRGPAYSYYRAGRYYRSNPGTTYSSRTYQEGRSYPTGYRSGTTYRRTQDGQQYRQQPTQQERVQGDQVRQQQVPPDQQNRGGGNGGGKGKGKGHGQGNGGGNGGGHGHGG